MNKLKICVMFPGQGSQKLNMGLSLSKISKKTKQVFECVSDIMNFNVLQLFEKKQDIEPDNRIFQTKFIQPAIVAVSLAAFIALKERNVLYDAVVGHSLGSMSALFAAECVSMEDCFKIVKYRSEAMHQCENEQNGSMCAIIGSNLEMVEDICKSASNYVTPANYNGIDQIVISGYTEAVKEVAEKLKQHKFKCVMLKVKAAFHSKLMEPAAKQFQQKLNSIEISEPKLKFYSNVTGNLISSSNNIKQLIVDQLTKPVLFTHNLQQLDKANYKIFIECGPTAPLCKMVKKTLSNPVTFSVSNEPDLNNVLTSLEKLNNEENF